MGLVLLLAQSVEAERRREGMMGEGEEGREGRKEGRSEGGKEGRISWS